MIPLGRSIATILIPAFLLYWHGGASAGNGECAHGCRCRPRAGHPKGPEPTCPAVSSGLGLPTLPLGSHAAPGTVPLAPGCARRTQSAAQPGRACATARESTETGTMRGNLPRAEGQRGIWVAEPCRTLGTLWRAGHAGRWFVLLELGYTSLLLHLSPFPSSPLS